MSNAELTDKAMAAAIDLRRSGHEHGGLIWDALASQEIEMGTLAERLAAAEATIAAARGQAKAINHDPEPWHERETGKRFSPSAVEAENGRGRCWLGLAFDPRPEYDTRALERYAEEGEGK